VDLVPQSADRNPGQLCGGITVTTLIGRRLNNEFALDLSNRTPDKALNSFYLVCQEFKRT
jgi:hypothetical protein